MARIDFTPYRRSTVGFDHLFDLLESSVRNSGDNYPPFNIEKRGDDEFRITLALAGFRPQDIDITAQQNLLTVTGRKQEESAQQGEMLHVGDRDHNDVKGPQQLGMKAILFTASRDVDKGATTADAICESFDELEAAIEQLDA